MEAEFGGKLVASDLKAALGKKSSLEWDLNYWKWDGNRTTAAPLNPVHTDYEAWRQVGDLSNGLERDSEKRRREGGLVIEEVEDEEREEGGDRECLRLMAGGPAYPIAAEEGEGKKWKKSKVVARAEASSNGGSNRAVCQVENCRADLSGAKDYHRRHKVCDMHSKASRALVANIMQRLCQ